MYFWAIMNPTRQLPYTLLVAGILLAASLVLARRPYYNWDMFPYMAIIMASPEVPFAVTHQRVYREAQSHMPEYDYKAIAARQPELKEDPTAFEAILRYHTLKPGYTAVAGLLFYLGVNPLAATWLPSIISYFMLGLVLFSWSRKLAPVPAAALFTFVIVLAPPMIDLARYSSPDMLCALVFTAGFVLVLRNLTNWGVAVMTLSILVRPDAVLLTAPVVGVLAVRKQLPLIQAIAWLAGGILLSLYLVGDQRVIGEYLLDESSFNERLALYRQGLTNLGNSFVIPMVTVAVFTLLLRRSTDLVSLFLWGTLLSMIARYLLHPFVEDRFFLPAYLVILLLTWHTVSPRVFQPGASKS